MCKYEEICKYTFTITPHHTYVFDRYHQIVISFLNLGAFYAKGLIFFVQFLSALEKWLSKNLNKVTKHIKKHQETQKWISPKS